MKTPFKILLPVAIFTISGIFFNSCKKESVTTSNDPVATTNTQVAMQDDAEADGIYDNVFDNVMADDEVGVGASIGIFGSANLGSDGKEVPGSPNGVDSADRCFKVTREPGTPGVFPKTITIDFGAGCTCKDGHIRKGKIVTVYTGRMIVPGSKATTTFVDYYVDSVKVEGTHEIANNSTQQSRIFTRTVTDGKLSKPNGNYIKWSATHTNTQTAGLGTPLYPLDDEFDITGPAQGENKHGADIFTWSRSITKALHKKFTCRWFVSGTITITRNGNTGTFDYGNGDCDNRATLTIGSSVKEITLH